MVDYSIYFLWCSYKQSPYVRSSLMTSMSRPLPVSASHLVAVTRVSSTAISSASPATAAARLTSATTTLVDRAGSTSGIRGSIKTDIGSIRKARRQVMAVKRHRQHWEVKTARKRARRRHGGERASKETTSRSRHSSGVSAAMKTRDTVSSSRNSVLIWLLAACRRTTSVEDLSAEVSRLYSEYLPPPCTVC